MMNIMNGSTIYKNTMYLRSIDWKKVEMVKV